MKRVKQFYLAITILCLVTIAFSTYYTLGGFDPVDVFVMKGGERTVIGKEYIVKYDYNAFHKKIQETIAEIDSGRLKGMLTVVFFENDMIGEDSVHYFIGVSIDEILDVLRLPSGYDYKEFRTEKIFKIFITQHPWIRPLSEEINEIMEIQSIEEGKVLQPYSFELYYKDGSLSIERWVR